MDILIKSVSKKYADHRVFHNFSQVIPKGETTALMAPSGKGKTTLLRLILGLEKPDSGEITGIPERCAAVFQEDRLCPELSVLGNIRMAVGRNVSRQQMDEMLRELGLADAADKPANQLSGGMARRAALARALLYDGELLVLDEPFNGLDGENREMAAAAIKKYAAGRTVLLVTHRQEDLTLLGARHVIEID